MNKTYRFYLILSAVLLVSIGSGCTSIKNTKIEGTLLADKGSIIITEKNTGITAVCPSSWECSENPDGGVSIFHPNAMANVVVTRAYRNKDTTEKTLEAEIEGRSMLFSGIILEKNIKIKDSMYAIMEKDNVVKDKKTIHLIMVTPISEKIYAACEATVLEEEKEYKKLWDEAKAVCESIKPIS